MVSWCRIRMHDGSHLPGAGAGGNYTCSSSSSATTNQAGGGMLGERGEKIVVKMVEERWEVKRERLAKKQIYRSESLRFEILLLQNLISI